jgi:hypothetical protein
MARKIKNELVAEICLYGASHCGSGWLVRLPDGRMFGDGELVKDRGMTAAVWQAQDAIEAAGVKSGRVRVFAAGGQMMADDYLTHRAYFGDLKWVPATMLVIEAAALETAAS